MASTLTSYSNLININYPVPGADNDSQGFRSNFSSIQSALGIASEEISNLQLNSVNLAGTNDFGYNIIKRATLQSCGELVNDESDATSPSSVDVNYALGTYQKFQINSGTTTFNVINWPGESNPGVYGKIRLELTPVNTWTSTVAMSGATVISNSTPVTEYTQTTPIFWDIWSDDGSAVYANYVGKAAP